MYLSCRCAANTSGKQRLAAEVRSECALYFLRLRAIKQATEATRCQSLDILEPAGRAAGQATDLHSVDEGHSDSPRYHGAPPPTQRLKHQPIASDTSSSAGTPTPVLGNCAVRSVSSADLSYGKSADRSVRINPVIPTDSAEGASSSSSALLALNHNLTPVSSTRHEQIS